MRTDPLKSLSTRHRIILYLAMVFPAIMFFSWLPHFRPENYVATHYAIAGDKWVHMASYFLASLLGLIIFHYNKGLVLLSFLLLFSISVLVECIQYFIPGRGFSWMDILFNAVGILLSYIIFRVKRGMQM